MQTPTVGRIVHFRRHGTDTPPLAAIVAAVLSDTSLNLMVIEHSGNPSGYGKVSSWDGSGDAPLEYWEWPKTAPQSAQPAPDPAPLAPPASSAPQGMQTTDNRTTRGDLSAESATGSLTPSTDNAAAEGADPKPAKQAK